jgi:hypothetical protein
MKKEKDILDFYKEFSLQKEALSKINEKFDWLEDNLVDIVCSSFGIPKDNTTDWSGEEQQKFGTTNNYPDNFFCRDYFTDALFEFVNKKISKKELVEILKNWKEPKI